MTNSKKTLNFFSLSDQRRDQDGDVVGVQRHRPLRERRLRQGQAAGDGAGQEVVEFAS